MSQKNTFDWMRQPLNGGHMSTEMRDMTGEQILPSGAMEGGGTYNKNAKLQASGAPLHCRIWRTPPGASRSTQIVSRS
jgi:hypothetical protein